MTKAGAEQLARERAPQHAEKAELIAGGSGATAFAGTFAMIARCLGLAGRDAVYVSAPITTGPDFAAWFPLQQNTSSDTYRERLKHDIVVPNLERAAPLVLAVRERWAGVPVIDPTALEDLPGWEQDDYHSFWTEVVARFAHTVVFSEGWEYSSGCALEFAMAVASGCTLLTSSFEPLPVDAGIKVLQVAASDLARVGARDALIRHAIELVQGLNDPGNNPSPRLEAR